MEENRLKPMKEGYDNALFNDLYARTQGLRRKLAAGIDSRRFGVDYDEVLSWFDVKFIYVFNKYQDEKTPDMLLGFLINSLTMFKNRILRKAYTLKHSQTIISLEDVNTIEELDFEEPFEENGRENFLIRAMDFLRRKISDNALMLLELQLNPPPYIIAKLRDKGIHKFTKIPNPIYSDYLGLGDSEDALAFVQGLQEEINYGLGEARSYFKTIAL